MVRIVLFETDVVLALELEDLTGLVRGGHLEPELVEDPAYLRNLLGVRTREPAFANPQAVLQTYPHVAAQNGGLHGAEHLVTPRSYHRPLIVVAEQPVGGALHVKQVFRMCTDASANAQDGLNKERRLHQTAIEKVRGGVQMADVVGARLAREVASGSTSWVV